MSIKMRKKLKVNKRRQKRKETGFLMIVYYETGQHTAQCREAKITILKCQLENFLYKEYIVCCVYIFIVNIP